MLSLNSVIVVSIMNFILKLYKLITCIIILLLFIMVSLLCFVVSRKKKLILPESGAQCIFISIITEKIR